MRFRTCSACAAFIRSRDPESLRRRATAIYESLSKNTHEDNRVATTVLVNSLMWQEVFWLGNSIDFTNVIALASAISPPFRVTFDMFNAGRSDADHPTYKNGVELFLWPLFDGVIVDTVQSNQRGFGHASKTMRLLVASADRHGVELMATVESDTYDPELPAGLDSDALQVWGQRLGFVLDADGITMRRKPDLTLSSAEREARYEQALKVL